MPWWQQRVYTEGMVEELAGPEARPVEDILDSNDIGFTVQRGQADLEEG